MVKPYSSRAKGRSLQDLLDIVCAQYKAKGVANINPVPVPYKRVRNYKGKLWVGCYAGKSTVDYVGVTCSGRAVAFDAKMTSLPTRVDLGDSHFPKHQRDFLRWYDKAGNIAFLVVEFVALGEIYRLPISPVLQYLDAGNASFPLERVISAGLRLRSSRGVVLDILSGIE
jgi:recombination protein U